MVAQYAFAFGFFKLTNYVLFFWLPYFLGKHFDPVTANLIASLYSVGMMPGGIIVGVVSDLFGGRRASVIGTFMAALFFFLFIFSKKSEELTAIPLLVMLAIMGILVSQLDLRKSLSTVTYTSAGIECLTWEMLGWRVSCTENMSSRCNSNGNLHSLSFADPTTSSHPPSLPILLRTRRSGEARSPWGLSQVSSTDADRSRRPSAFSPLALFRTPLGGARFGSSSWGALSQVPLSWVRKSKRSCSLPVGVVLFFFFSLGTYLG